MRAPFHRLRYLPPMALCLLVLVALAGCQTLGEWAQALAPLVSDTVANSLALSLGDAINQAASGQPIGPDELHALSMGIREGMTEAVRAGVAEQGGGWDSFLAGLSGGISGLVGGGGVAYLKGKTAKV